MTRFQRPLSDWEAVLMKNHFTLHYSQFIIIVFLILSASLLRLPSLTMNSLWMDELYSATITLVPFKTKIASLWNDVHPPLFNGLIYLWNLAFGNSELALRMLPAFIGIATVPIAFLVFKKTFGILTTFMIALLIVTLPSHIYYSQELRSYILAFLFAMTSVGTLFWYLKEPSVKHRWLLAISCAALFATHYIGIFFIISIFGIGVLGIPDHWQTKLKRSLHLAISIFLLILPNLPHFLYKRVKMDEYWPDPVTVEIIKNTVVHMVDPINSYKEVLSISGLAILVTYAALVISATVISKYRFHGYFFADVIILVILSISPLVGVIAISLLSPQVTVLIPRIMIVFASPVVVLAGVGIVMIGNGRMMTSVVVLLMIFCGLWLYSNSYYTVATKSDFRSVAYEVGRLQDKHGNLVLISLENPLTTLKRGAYYWKMFNVPTDLIIFPEKDMSEGKLVNFINEEMKKQEAKKLVLFSQHRPRSKYIIEVCDKYFRQEEKKAFSGFGNEWTLTVIYTLGE